MAEAERFWKVERLSGSVTNLAALSTLCIAAMMHGKDEFSLRLLDDSRSMAERMRLLNVVHTPDLIDEFQSLSPNDLRALSYVAWGTYSWLR
jgi:hypothetical protein